MVVYTTVTEYRGDLELNYDISMVAADTDIRGPGSADILVDADGPRIRQTNIFVDEDHLRI